MSPPDIARCATSLTLFAAWTARAGRARAVAMLDGVAPPGPVALRARYRHLLDPASRVVEGENSLTRDKWIEIIEHEAAGDVSLIQHPTAAADHFHALLELEPSPSLRIVTVNALQGLGDAARQLDDPETAARRLIAALEMATADGYRFGQARALVSLGYLAMVFTSAGDASEYFAAASALCRQIPDPLYEANAELGAAEVALRTGDHGVARDAAAQALRVFDNLGSHMGAANAAERLAGAHRALQEPDAAASALAQALEHYQAAGAVIGQVNVLDAQGELFLAAGDLARARESFTAATEVAAGHGYQRGVLNSQQGLARTERAAQRWSTAAELHQATLTGYQDLHDLVGQMHSYDGLAHCARALDGAEAELAVRIESVQALERLRAAHADHRVQTEYRSRFLGMYRATMRTAIELRHVHATLFVLECLAGRRLAGLIEATPTPAENGVLAAHVVALADQRLAGKMPPHGDRRERVLRMLGATAVRHGLAERARSELETLAASLFLPLDPGEAEGLLEAVPDGCHVLMLALDATTSGKLAYLWRDPSGRTEVGSLPIDAPARALIDATNDPRGGFPTVPVLSPLAGLLPDPLRAALAAAPHPPTLLLVPIGALWNLPWPAVALDEQRVLGETVDLVVCPSLTVHRAISRRAPSPPPDGTVLWRNPTIAHHRYPSSTALGAPVQRIDDGELARAAVLNNPGGQSVVIGHGRPVEGGVYLELHPGNVITAAEVLSARPPSRLALICCWGLAQREPSPGDPLTLGIMAMLAGAREVVATVAELGDSVEATMFVHRILASRQPTLAAATREATTTLLAQPGVRNLPVAHWAPVVTLSVVGGSA